MPFERRMRFAVESLAKIASYAADAGVAVAVENMLPLQAFSTSEEIVRLLNEIGMPNVGICFDTSHAQLAREGIEWRRNWAKGL